MLRTQFMFAVCALTAGCAGESSQGIPRAAATEAAAAVIDMAAKSCPWPADAANFAQTTLIARHHGAPPPDLDVLHDLHGGCSIMTFSVDESGIVAESNVLAEYPAGFGRVAARILRWNDYATGTSADTIFMVRLAAQQLPQGGVLMSLGFVDNTINIAVPVGAGQ